MNPTGSEDCLLNPKTGYQTNRGDACADKTSIAYKKVAESLWCILDDIDTLSDMIKPTDLNGYARFYQTAMEKVRARHNHLISDGYYLYLPKKCEEKIKE